MVIKKYVAKSMREALAEIKNELGESAVILKTRKLASGFPFAGGEIEVTAGIDEQAKPQPAIPAPAVATAHGIPGVYGRPRPSCIVADGENVNVRPWLPSGIKAGRKPVVNAGIVENDNQTYDELKKEVEQLKELVRTAVTKPAPTPAVVCDEPTRPAIVESPEQTGIWSGLRKRLIEAEVTAGLADRLIADASRLTDNPERAESALCRLMQNRFQAAGPIRCKSSGPRVIAFVGPAGAGKTTTIAKLAARCRAGNQKKISFITMDTYRIAATEQIKTMAEIMKARLHVVYSADEIPAALAACVGDELVFVDTAGRSRRNADHLEELKNFLQQIGAAETHLVLSATMKDSDLRESIKYYAPLGINRLLFTKLDETARLGNVFSAAATGSIPVSFLAGGQNIPDDLELAQSARFIDRLWRNSANA